MVVFLFAAMDVSKILVWNVRGLNNKARRDALRELVASTRTDIICLQETKVQNMSTRILLSAFGCEMDQHICLPAQGTRGGILIAWSGAIVQAI